MPPEKVVSDDVGEQAGTILEWRREFTEGEQFLTPEIRAELRGYNAEELTRRSIIVVVQKCAR